MVSSGRIRGATMARARAAAEKSKATRLDAAAWVAAAFDALADGGIDAVRVEPLAKALGITKGSFYWHFADRRALLDAMLDAWMRGPLRGDPRAGAVARRTGGGAAPACRSLYPQRQCRVDLRSSSRSARWPAPTKAPRRRCAASIASACSRSVICSPRSAGRAARRRRVRCCSTAIAIRAC